ncbi:hypothetical protein M446_4083 [Methylobacterium sp. 4-46]|nr:hypothetical protein M446_4083 [Methylobacterium sp. 4-46]
MDSFRALIVAYGLSEFAADIGVHENTAKQMRKRDSVAPEYWDAWVRGARVRGVGGVTLERLASIAAQRRVRAAPTTPELAEARP